MNGREIVSKLRPHPLTRVEDAGKGFMTSMAVVQRCVGVEGMTGAMARGRELEKGQ